MIEPGITATHFGRTSIALRCEVRNKITRKSIPTIEKVAFVNHDESSKLTPHEKTKITYMKDLFEGGKPLIFSVCLYYLIYKNTIKNIHIAPVNCFKNRISF